MNYGKFCTSYRQCLHDCHLIDFLNWNKQTTSGKIMFLVYFSSFFFFSRPWTIWCILIYSLGVLNWSKKLSGTKSPNIYMITFFRVITFIHVCRSFVFCHVVNWTTLARTLSLCVLICADCTLTAFLETLVKKCANGAANWKYLQIIITLCADNVLRQFLLNPHFDLHAVCMHACIYVYIYI